MSDELYGEEAIVWGSSKPGVSFVQESPVGKTGRLAKADVVHGSTDFLMSIRRRPAVVAWEYRRHNRRIESTLNMHSIIPSDKKARVFYSVVSAGGDITPDEVAEALGLDYFETFDILNELIREGLVERTE